MRIRGGMAFGFRLAASGGMPGMDVLCTLEAEVRHAAVVLRFHGLEPEAYVVAEVVAGMHASYEPAGDVRQQRDASRAGRPLAELELVDLIARLAAEQLRERALRAAKEVDRDDVRLRDDVERPVLLRDARQEARRMNAALRREADQAAGALAVTPDRRDDEDRPVEPRYELREVAQAAKCATRSFTPWSLCASRRADILRISRRAAWLSERI